LYNKYCTVINFIVVAVAKSTSNDGGFSRNIILKDVKVDNRMMMMMMMMMTNRIESNRIESLIIVQRDVDGRVYLDYCMVRKLIEIIVRLPPYEKDLGSNEETGTRSTCIPERNKKDAFE
jgi:hypothetical protein